MAADVQDAVFLILSVQGTVTYSMVTAETKVSL